MHGMDVMEFRPSASVSSHLVAVGSDPSFPTYFLHQVNREQSGQCEKEQKRKGEGLGATGSKFPDNPKSLQIKTHSQSGAAYAAHTHILVPVTYGRRYALHLPLSQQLAPNQFEHPYLTQVFPDVLFAPSKLFVISPRSY